VLVEPGVRFGARTVLQAPCVVGRAPLVRRPESCRWLWVKALYPIRSPRSMRAASSEWLPDGQGASVREDNVIGDDVSVGTKPFSSFGNRIGNRVRIHSGCFLEMVTIEDDVFVDPTSCSPMTRTDGVSEVP